jgi:DNA-directed RNA polymerase specialized sigma24 family protein
MERRITVQENGHVSFVDTATTALEQAQRQNCDLLHRLLGRTIAHIGPFTTSQIDEIRSDIYYRLAKPLNAGKPYIEIAAQLYLIIRRATIDYIRRQTNQPSTIPIEDVQNNLADPGAGGLDWVLSGLENERLDRIIRELKSLRDSPKRSDNRRFIAVVAYANGRSPFEALRQSEPTMTKANASQILSRGLELLRQRCQSVESTKAS